ncbi:hypothetical protein FA13DRAFT_1721912 [Coprinellus micaceus]|uniref:Uncharacterized protein n=1 Tax=Coprinellus micaceus TaxID=71717 RepID=A0A4Y7RV72_COPMI|nr:hypothetical protein FA13DRAFT_1721912 [Coprinellus micaceus]
MCGKLDMFMRITLKNGLEHKNSQRKRARYGKDTEETPVRENNQVSTTFNIDGWVDCVNRPQLMCQLAPLTNCGIQHVGGLADASRTNGGQPWHGGPVECGGSVHDTRPTLAQLGGGLSSSAKSQFTIPTEQLQWPTLRTSAERGAKGQSTTFIPHLQWGWHGIVVMRTVKGEVTIPAKCMSNQGGAAKHGGSVHGYNGGGLAWRCPQVRRGLAGRDPVAPGGANRTRLADGPQYIDAWDMFTTAVVEAEVIALFESRTFQI